MESRKRIYRATNVPLKFQIFEFVCEDTDDEEFRSADDTSEMTAATDDDDRRYRTRSATIYAFGVTEEGYSVCAAVTGFLPFFFIELDPTATDYDFLKALRDIAGGLSSYHQANMLLEKCAVVSRMSFYGFQNSKKRKFGYIRFKTFATCKNVFYKLTREGKYSTFEGKLDQLFKYLHTRKFESWVEIPANAYKSAGYAKTQICVEVDCKQFNAIEEAKIAPLRQCTVDIETHSSRSTERNLEQCDPTILGDVCFQIASAFKTFGSAYGEFDLKHIIVVGPCDEWDEESTKERGAYRTIVKRCATEAEALVEWAKLMEDMDPDIIYTWNGDYFDFHYMVERATLLNVDYAFLSRVSRIRHKPAEMEDAKFESKAYGLSEFRRLQMYGRINADLLPYFRKETKHRLYKLGYIADQYGVGDKNPVTVHMIFASFREQNSAKIAEVARYCIQDTLLPQLLVDKLKIIPNLVELSRATYAPIRYLLHRGQQIRIMCLLSRHTREASMLIPDIKDKRDDPESNEESDDSGKEGVVVKVAAGKGKLKMTTKGYQGATVLPPKSGAYYQPITTLDFASLYPSIMRADNLCYSTFVMDEKVIEDLPDELIFTVNDENGAFSHKFVKKEVHEGILPKLLANLAQLRKNAKKDLFIEQSKAYPDEFVCSILDARQLSKKLIMNSCYGFLATQSLPCKQIGETVTAKGREMIERTRAYIEGNYANARVIYGDTDSVFVDFNLCPIKYPTMKEKFEFASQESETITKALFEPPHNLEFEKIYQPLFMLMKKRYFGLKYTKWDKPPTVDNRGVVIQRRDVCPFVQETFTACRDLVLYDTANGGERALLHLSAALDNLIEENVALEKCAITKTYSKDYANPMAIPHAAVAMKMRGKGAEVCKGDKIEFVYARRRGQEKLKHQKMSETAQDIELVRTNKNYVIDARHYFALVEQPVCQFMDYVVGVDVMKELFNGKLRTLNEREEKSAKRRLLNLNLPTTRRSAEEVAIPKKRPTTPTPIERNSTKAKTPPSDISKYFIRRSPDTQ